ncbi:MAG: serine acetyltransferase [Candidatus Bathyarchaeota archaeon]|nr:serine acetyltransferase [Candidatus Bathyarchaeota archaeon]
MNLIKHEIKEKIESDFHRFQSNGYNFKNLFKLFFRQPCFRYMFIYRLASGYSKKNPIGILSRLWFNLMKGRFGLQIYLNAKIGKGFKLNHYGNIIINQGAIIGENCNVSQGVTIGNISRGKLKGCPNIGDRVWIGANAVVVGKINIGNDVLIAPLTYVNCDIPANAVVSGNPCTINSYNGSGVYVKNLYSIKS